MENEGKSKESVEFEELLVVEIIYTQLEGETWII